MANVKKCVFPRKGTGQLSFLGFGNCCWLTEQIKQWRAVRRLAIDQIYKEDDSPKTVFRRQRLCLVLLKTFRFIIENYVFFQVAAEMNCIKYTVLWNFYFCPILCVKSRCFGYNNMVDWVTFLKITEGHYPIHEIWLCNLMSVFLFLHVQCES